MYPFIPTPFGGISTFTLMAIIGILAMLWGVYRSVYKENCEEEVAFIFPRIVFCGLIGFAFAAFTDALFKYIEYGEFKLYGITFYGGLIGAFSAMYIILKCSKGKTGYSINEWFNILTPCFIVFHMFGRIGCFLGGCCYGRYSQSVFAVSFPDNVKNGIFHYGQKCLPTQLFEVAALIIILLIIMRSKNRVKTYLCLYALVRFGLEFLRGDDRGDTMLPFSPSQLISVLILLALLIYEIVVSVVRKHKHT